MLRILVDSAFRRHVASRVQNPHVRKFWLEEYEGYPARFRAEAIAPIQNKVGAFITNPILHRIVGRATGSFDMRRVMDEGKILIVNLAKGKIGEDAAALLGAMLVSKVSLAALSRADVPEHTRRDFYLYADEFQNYTTLSLASMLSELRKYRVNLILAHQYLAQLDLPIKSAILGNAGTIISFRVGMEDAEIIAKEFYPVFAPVDLVSLPNHQIYLRLMVDGRASHPFSADTVEDVTTEDTKNSLIQAVLCFLPLIPCASNFIFFLKFSPLLRHKTLCLLTIQMDRLLRQAADDPLPANTINVTGSSLTYKSLFAILALNVLQISFGEPLGALTPVNLPSSSFLFIKELHLPFDRRHLFVFCKYTHVLTIRLILLLSI